MDERPAFSVFGDSISTFKGVTDPRNACYYDALDTNGNGITDPSQTWWMRVIDAEGGRLISNVAFSGSMVAGAGFPAGRSPERAQQALGAHGEEPDVILVFIGINDYGWGSARAQEEGGSEASPAKWAGRDVLHAEPGSAPPDGLEEFASAYAEMLANLRAQAPHADIRCLTIPIGRPPGAETTAFCYALRGIPFEDYNEAIRACARAADADLVDISVLGYDYESTDGTHPTSLGMQQIASMVQLASGREGGEELPERLRTTRSCYEPTCMGCPHARSTGSKWSCVCERDL